MCGLFGAVIIKPTEDDFERLRRLFVALEPRGPHASGVAWIRDKKIHIEKESTRARFFVDCVMRLDEMVNEDGNLYMLGHTRWTTSDLFDHQPIGNKDFALVHNGVVSWEHPDDWHTLFGIETETGNDSELIWQSRLNAPEIHPVHRFSTSSIAVCELFADTKTLVAYRNHARPLAMYADTRCVVFSSTEKSLDIAGYESSHNWGMVESYTEFFTTVDFRGPASGEYWVTDMTHKKHQRFFPDIPEHALGDK